MFETMTNLASIYRSVQKHGDAMRLLDRQLWDEFYSNFTHILIWLLRIYCIVDRAKLFFNEKAIPPALLNTMGQVLHDLQQFDDSEKAFQEALAAVTDEDSNAYRTISGTVIYCDFAAGLS